MTQSSRSAIAGYGIVAAGAALALTAAVVPFYGAGHRLDAAVLIAGLLPYPVYGVLVAFPHGPLTLPVGLVTLATHAALVARERFLDHADYGDGWIYYVPLALTATLIALATAAFRRPWHR